MDTTTHLPHTLKLHRGLTLAFRLSSFLFWLVFTGLRLRTQASQREWEVGQRRGPSGSSRPSASPHSNQRQREERRSKPGVCAARLQCRKAAGVWVPAAQPGLGRGSDAANADGSTAPDFFSKKQPFCCRREVPADRNHSLSYG